MDDEYGNRLSRDGMKHDRKEVLFTVLVVSVIALLALGGLFVQTSQVPRTVQSKRLAIQTWVCACPNPPSGKTVYEWDLSLTNEGREPVTAVTAVLDISTAAYVGQGGSAPRNGSYTMSQFLILQGLAPPGAPLVKSPPPPILESNDPLAFNFTASASTTLFQAPPYLQLSQSLPVTIAVTYSNGTLSNLAISAQVFEGP